MKTDTIKLVLTFILVFAFLWPTGCGLKPKPFDYEPVSEMKDDEPGIFTGEKGHYVIYSSEKKAKAAESHQEQAMPQKRVTDATPPAADMEEFRRFQEWKQEKQEFEEFQEWKRSKEGREAYDEFLEWKRWQSFKRWQESQSKSE